MRPAGAASSFSCSGGSEAAGVRSGSSVLMAEGEVTGSCWVTVAGVPDATAAAVAAAVAGPATAAAYRIGGKVVFGTLGTGGAGSAGLAALIMGSALVLSIVDFLDGCFLPWIGLDGSSAAAAPAGVEVDVLRAGVDFSFFSSFAGVFMTDGGGGEASVGSTILAESRFDRSSLCEMSCRYSSSSCKLRSS